MALRLLLAAALAAQDAEASRRIRDLVEQLGSDDVVQRERAAQALKAAPDAALPELRKAAQERRGEVAARAQDLIRWIEVQKLLTPRLKKLFPDLEKEVLEGRPRAWSGVFYALKHDDDPELDDLSDRERGTVYERALQEAQSDDAREEILDEASFRPGAMQPSGVIALLASPDADLRAASARALGFVGGSEAVAALRKALGDPESRVQWRAAEALGRLQARDAAPDLKRLLAHPSIAGEAARALGRMGARDAQPDLRALLVQENAYVRRSAAFALADLGVDDSLRLVADVLRREEFAIQLDAAEWLEAQGARAVPTLRECLKDRNPVARRLAAEALGKMGAAEAVPDLEALLADPEARVREGAVDALEDLRPEGRSGVLIPLLRDPAWEVRRSAARALGTMGAKEAAPELRARLDDSAPYVSITAATSLARLGDRAGVPLLLREARDRHKLVKQAIPLTALNALREPAAWERLRSAPLGSAVSGRASRVLRQLCDASGLELELSDGDSDLDESDDPWMERRLRIAPRPKSTLLGAIEGVGGRGAYGFILEARTLRVVPHSESIRFWSEWWKSQEGK